MIAVIKTGGKQYKVSPKDKLKIEKIEGEEGAKIVFDEVLLISSEDGQHISNTPPQIPPPPLIKGDTLKSGISQEWNIKIGDPFIKGAKVEATILKQARSKKVMVIKHKAKKRYNRKAGHRQYFTEVEIVKIAV